ncbi:MAG: hypothetical protein ABI212_14660 [Burkholderiaceae bacterium]
MPARASQVTPTAALRRPYSAIHKDSRSIPSGNVFLADTSKDVVHKLTPDGTVSAMIGQVGLQRISLGLLPASLCAPTGVDVDLRGT